MPVTIDLSQTPDDESEEGNEQSVLLGSLRCNIVGIRYYDGVAHPGEFVTLTREPSNPYDRNAIRVDNIAGSKVGHIKATTAAMLSPVMDRYPHITIDGTIPYKGNAYTLPLHVEFFGQSEADADLLGNILGHSWTKSKTFSNPSAPTTEVSPTSVTTTTKTLDWRSAEQQLDEMFEKLTGEQLQNLPQLVVPTTLTAELMEHQVLGLRWLYQRETSTAPPPFYRQVEEKGQSVWFSEVTNSSQRETPQPVFGSILADSMGLGKTIQTIALILANPPAATETNPTTLIVCPLSVIQSWQSQIAQHVKPRTLKVGVYQGPSRYDLLEESAAEGPWDVLIAPYGTVRADFDVDTPKKKGAKKKAKTGPSIFSKTFHRVVLDEAHQIRNPKAQVYLACKELKTRYRLCLTGTPIQNKPVDLQSLFGFLQVPNLEDPGIFRRAITQPIQAGDPVGFARLRTTMAHLSLRRTKDCLDLVEKTVELRMVEFRGSPHSRIHDLLFNSVKHVFSAMEDATAMKNYMMILEALTRIRQACVSGCMVPKERIELAEKVLDELQQKGSTISPADAEKILMKLKGAFSEDLVECSICFEEMEESTAAMLRTCHHVFCEGCLTTVSNQCDRKCPLCRTGFAPADMIKKSTALEASQSSVQDKSEKASETLTALGPSPKLLALEAAIKEMSKGERGVIFSQFTKFLDLVGPHLEKLGYTYARIDGKKTGKQRVQALTLFATADGPDFMLCSLHAAGTGITLTSANHCFMMDTWWNVSVELQAQDRIHRIGQTRPVRVVRFVMKDSIEERMIALQESKAAMSKGAVQKLSSTEIRKTRIRDLKSLFGETDD